MLQYVNLTEGSSMKKYLFLLSLAFFIGCGGGGSKTIDESVPRASDTNPTVSQEVESTSSKILDYLNSLRRSAGMVELKEIKELDTAAYNHANYLYVNNETGHYEDPDKKAFTGEWPWDRIVYANYLTKFVAENVSSGQKNYILSIDGLFSAIYHRFGFLKEDIDTIGIGIKGLKYVYDMSNSNLNTLCASDNCTSGRCYTNVCKDDDIKIPEDDFNQALSDIRALNDDIIIWPYKDATNIMPVFYEENPDPLPDYSVSGYPISVQFNSYYFSNDVTLKWFKLYDKNGNEITDVRLIDKDNDPNDKFSNKEFALFPLKRLEWDSSYSVSVGYSYDGEDYTITWSFKTQKLPYDYFRIDNDDETIYVPSNKTYAYYFVPKDGNDTISGYSYSYPSGDSVESGFIDANTIWIKVVGDSGDEFNFDFDNGNKLTLIVQ